jgi:hypothetical protein
MHGLVWTDKPREDISKYWKYGIVDIGKKGVGEASAGYLVKYMSKVDEKHREYNSKIFASKGIGSGYLERKDVDRHKYDGGDTKKDYRDRKANKLPLPKYFRDKIWTDEEREWMFRDSMEEEKAYVLGKEIDISTLEGKIDYDTAIRYGRKKSERYGYPGRKDFDKSLYRERKLKDNKFKRYEQERKDSKKRLDEWNKGD